MSTEAIEHAQQLLGGLAQRNVSLARFTGYRVAGRAALFCSIGTESELTSFLSIIPQLAVPVLSLGRGSNLLISDRGFEGLAISLDGDFAGWTQLDEGTIVGGAATGLPALARQLGQAGLSGMEWCIGVPGSLGGAVRTNAGCHDADMAGVVADATVADLTTGNTAIWTNDDIEFVFRGSALRSSDLVLNVSVRVERADPRSCAELNQRYSRYRKDNHPGGRNTGSVFTTKDAWRLVRDSGAQELSVGVARVSSKHANFIEVDRRARRGADDVFELMCQVRDRVFDRTGISLHTETHLIGFTEHEHSRLGLEPSD